MNREAKIQMIKDLLSGKRIEEIQSSFIGGVIIQTTLKGCKAFIETGDPDNLRREKYPASEAAYIFDVAGKYYFTSIPYFNAIAAYSDENKRFMALPPNGYNVISCDNLHPFDEFGLAKSKRDGAGMAKIES